MLSRRRKRLRITEQATKAQATTTEELNEDDEFGGEDDLRAFADATAGDKDIDVSLIDDTIATISLLSNRHENSFAQLNIPPVILWHQLYCILSNRTFVDQAVNQLRKKQVLLTFKISTGKDDVAIIMLKEYQDLIEKSREHLHSMKIERNDQQETVDSKCRALSRFLYALKDLNTSPLAISLTLFIEKFLKLKSARHLSMSQRVRIIPKSLDEETIRHDIQILRQMGFLLPTVGIHEEEFHLSIPHIGRLITSINKTRSFVLSVLKRTKYKEILESQLKKLKLRDSCFKLDYHLAEMEGGGLIRRTKLTTDHLIGIVQD